MSNELDADLVPQVECSGCKKTFDWDLIESGTCPLCQPKEDLPSREERAMATELSELRPGCLEAMEATLTLCQEINEKELCVNDLTQVCRLAIGHGHDMAIIALSMMITAIQSAKDATED